MLLGLGVLLGGCSDSTDDSGSTNIAGTWNATALSVTNASDPSESEDLIAAGVTLKLVLQANHSYLTIISFPGGPPDSSGGTYAQTASNLVLTDSSSSAEVTTLGLAVTGSTMVLSDGNINFDFGMGEVPALLDATLHKQ
jgi:hypothetical protein